MLNVILFSYSSSTLFLSDYKRLLLAMLYLHRMALLFEIVRLEVLSNRKI